MMRFIAAVAALGIGATAVHAGGCCRAPQAAFFAPAPVYMAPAPVAFAVPQPPVYLQPQAVAFAAPAYVPAAQAVAFAPAYVPAAQAAVPLRSRTVVPRQVFRNR